MVMNYKQKIAVLLGAIILATPLIASAAANAAIAFEDPLSGGMTPTEFLKRLINYIISLLGFIALLGIVYGSVIIVLGGMKSEQDLNRGKQIIFWALMGLLITGMAAALLNIIGGLLGF